MPQNNNEKKPFDLGYALEFLALVGFILLTLILGLTFYDRNFAGPLGDPSRDTTSAFVEFPVGILLVWLVFGALSVIALITKTRQSTTLVEWFSALFCGDFSQNQAKSYHRVVKSLEIFLIFVTIVLILMVVSMWFWRLFWLIKGII